MKQKLMNRKCCYTCVLNRYCTLFTYTKQTVDLLFDGIANTFTQNACTLVMFSYKHNKEDLKFEGVGVVFVEPILTGFEGVADLEAFVLDLPPGQL